MLGLRRIVQLLRRRLIWVLVLIGIWVSIRLLLDLWRRPRWGLRVGVGRVRVFTRKGGEGVHGLMLLRLVDPFGDAVQLGQVSLDGVW